MQYFRWNENPEKKINYFFKIFPFVQSLRKISEKKTKIIT